jgi:hypothetical protein
MSLNVNLQALSVPFGTEFPGTVQDFLDLIAQYMEVTGLEDFNGVNYGSVEPDPADRDKAWFKTDSGGTPLGWYTWNGTAWVVLPAKATVGTVAQRDAITAPQDGQMFQVVGTGLYVWSETASAWDPTFPATIAPQAYDRTYLFDAYQQLAITNSNVSSWTAVDLTDFITGAGLTTIKGVLLSIDCSFPDQGFGPPVNYSVIMRATADNTVSTSSNSLLKAVAQGTRDDSRTSAASQNFGMLPVTTPQTIYYNVAITNAVGGVATLWLCGFIY